MDYSQYSEPVVWRQYRDNPQPEPRMHTPDTSLDAQEIRRLAGVGALPALGYAVGLVVFSPIPISALVWLVQWPWQTGMAGWILMLIIAVYITTRRFDVQTQHWLNQLDRQVDATINYMESKTPPRVEVSSEAAPIIQGRPVMPRYDKHTKKVIRLAYWVRRAIENKDGKDGKPGPRLMRHDLGEYSVIIKPTGEEVDQETQRADYAELVRLKFLVLEGKGYKIADPTWTLEQAAALLEKALQHDTD